MKTKNPTVERKPLVRRRRKEPTAPAVPYKMRLPDGRILCIEVPARMTTRDRSGGLAFTLAGVRLLDRARALAAPTGMKTKRKARMGRPPIPAKDRRAAPLTFRFTREERRRIEAAAARAGVSLSDLARRRLLGEA